MIPLYKVPRYRALAEELHVLGLWGEEQEQSRGVGFVWEGRGLNKELSGGQVCWGGGSGDRVARRQTGMKHLTGHVECCDL